MITDMRNINTKTKGIAIGENPSSAAPGIRAQMISTTIAAK
jgi:hypothetical protein